MSFMALKMSKVLVDTHIALWLLTDDDKLPNLFRQKMLQEEHNWIFHQASIWEIQMKYDLGKLPLPTEPRKFLPKAIEKTGFIIEPIEYEAIFMLGRLPSIHRDPFDRLLISHAVINNWKIATVDSVFEKYPVKLFE